MLDYIEVYPQKNHTFHKTPTPLDDFESHILPLKIQEELQTTHIKIYLHILPKPSGHFPNQSIPNYFHPMAMSKIHFYSVIVPLEGMHCFVVYWQQTIIKSYQHVLKINEMWLTIQFSRIQILWHHTDHNDNERAYKVMLDNLLYCLIISFNTQRKTINQAFHSY